MYKPIVLEDEYSYTLHMQGSCSTLPIIEERDLVAELRQVCKEVAGIELKERNPMGFY